MAEYIEREALEVALNHRLNFLMAENGEYDHYTSGFDEHDYCAWVETLSYFKEICLEE